MSVFKAYDIRGTWPDQIDVELSRRIGEAFTRLLGARTLVVGRDMRTMAPEAAQAFIAGARKAGADVTDIGLASTPMTYYAIGKSGVDGGVQVTASHNPPEYIGFKFCRKGCVPVSGATGIKDLERMVAEAEPAGAATQGGLKEEQVLEGYIDHVLSFGPDIKPLKIVVDTSNGMAGHAIPRVLERLPVQAEVLFAELDGSFPNHEADPLKVENLKWVSEAVKRSGADIGMAFDGDADRCVFVDERGEPVRSDFVTGLFCERFLKLEKGATVVYDLRSTRMVRETIERLGGKAVRERVGHSFIKATMREHGAIFGGELSGHFYFRDNFVCDSGEIALVAMLSILSEKQKPFSELVKPYMKYPSTGEINFRVDDAKQTLQEMEKRFSDARIDHVDGVTISYADWWFNLRMSNTEPLVRLNMEADRPDLLAEKKDLLTGLLGEPE